MKLRILFQRHLLNGKENPPWTPFPVELRQAGQSMSVLRSRISVLRSRIPYYQTNAFGLGDSIAVDPILNTLGLGLRVNCQVQYT